MTRFVALAVCLGVTTPLLADPKPTAKAGIEGYWLGTLQVGAVELRLGFDIKKKDDGTLSATLDSIDQGARNVPVETATFADDTLTLKSPKMKLTYTGKFQPDGQTIKGELDQGVKLPLDLKRQDKPIALNRPQRPKKPYPYVEEEVTFPSKAKDVTLAGTFTRPKGDGPFPAAILITGSGPQDRDESLLGHQPFLVIADHLTRQGIAVLRYDDRGVGKSTGKFDGATSKDFADDAAGAVACLKARKEVGKIGLIGHSEGGMIAPMVAADCPDIAFIVLLAGPGTSGEEILIAQGQALVRAMGGDEKALARQKRVQQTIFELVRSGADEAKLKAALADFEKELTDAEKKEFAKARSMAEAQVARVAGAWFKYFLAYDPRPTLAKVRCPVLALNGEKDLQVPAKENLAEIEKALKAAGNTDVTVKELTGLNHLFQTCKTGLPTEYGKIEETFAPAALAAISEWIAKRK
ncbi:MAG TPA: alpha/beta hydrolase [Gemmataceae bacterium]|nr:alpha/beta hydrolase [Gemmataceae bacterium]